MRDYAKIPTRFWTCGAGKQIKKLGKEALIISMYLKSCEMANMIGIYYLALPLMAHQTELTLEEATKGLKSLCEVGFCTYDASSEYIWIHDMVLDEVGEELKANDNRVKAVNTLFHNLPKLPFLQAFYDRYGEALKIEKLSPSEAPQDQLGSQKAVNSKKDIYEPNGSLSEHKGSDEAAPPDNSKPKEPPKKPPKPKYVHKPCPYKEIVELYHRILPMCPRVLDLTKKRRGFINARWQDYHDLELWVQYFELVKESKFLTGKGLPNKDTGRVFCADIEWLTNPNNFVKVMEGRYKNK